MKIALVFDKLVRPDTTGVYCEKALRSLGHTILYYAPLSPAREGTLVFNGYSTLDPQCDLYLQMDDDLSYPGPIEFNPSISYLLNNRAFILSEESPLNPYPGVDIPMAGYGDLVARCRYFLSRPDEMAHIRQLTYDQFKRHYPMAELIRKVL